MKRSIRTSATATIQVSRYLMLNDSMLRKVSIGAKLRLCSDFALGAHAHYHGPSFDFEFNPLLQCPESILSLLHGNTVVEFAASSRSAWYFFDEMPPINFDILLRVKIKTQTSNMIPARLPLLILNLPG